MQARLVEYDEAAGVGSILLYGRLGMTARVDNVLALNPENIMELVGFDCLILSPSGRPVDGCLADWRRVRPEPAVRRSGPHADEHGDGQHNGGGSHACFSRRMANAIRPACGLRGAPGLSRYVCRSCWQRRTRGPC